MSDNIDNGASFSENETNNANNEIVIRLDEKAPLNDPNCEHQFVIDDDTIGEYQAWVCTKCPRGVFLPKTVTVI